MVFMWHRIKNGSLRNFILFPLKRRNGVPCRCPARQGEQKRSLELSLFKAKEFFVAFCCVRGTRSMGFRNRFVNNSASLHSRAGCTLALPGSHRRPTAPSLGAGRNHHPPCLWLTSFHLLACLLVCHSRVGTDA